jgi:histidinol-phosphatase (PHP family)
MKTNYHTHVKLCGHATGMSADYIKKAIELGYDEIGMSDHGPIPRDWMSSEEYEYHWLHRQMTVSDFSKLYLPDLENTIKLYGDQISIKKGLEIEYVPGKKHYFEQLLKQLDYLNLGVHYFFHQGTSYNSYEALSPKQINYYASTVEEALATKWYKILVHPDLFLYSYTSSNQQFREFDGYALDVSKRIIEAAIKNDVALEINAGGVAKGKFMIHGKYEYVYPRTEFWKLVKEYQTNHKIKVVIGADAHTPSALGDQYYEETIAFAKALGIAITDKLEF